MATILELAQFSSAVYGGTHWTPNENWVFVGSSETNPYDYYGEAYQNIASGEIVIVNRGTRPTSLPDLINDLKLSTAISTPAQDAAAQFAIDIHNRYPDAPIIETGHSLGGNDALAATVELAKIVGNGVTAVVFNSPGIGGYAYDANTTYHVLSIYDQGDLIHLAGGSHLGAISQELPAGPPLAPIPLLALLAAGAPVIGGAVLAKTLYNAVGPAHSIDTVVSYLQNENPTWGSIIFSSGASIPQAPSGSLDLTYTSGTLVFSDTAGNSASYTIGEDNSLSTVHWSTAAGVTADYLETAQGYELQIVDSDKTTIYRLDDDAFTESVDYLDNRAYAKTVYSDGSWQIENTDQSGQVSHAEYGATGVGTTTITNSAGQLISKREYLSDGSRTDFQALSNGDTLNVRVSADGTVEITNRYAYGYSTVSSLDINNTLTSITNSSDGTVVTTVIYPDGRDIATTQMSDGTEYVSTTYITPWVNTVDQTLPGGETTHTVYLNRYLVKEVTTSEPDGRIRTETYSNGTLSTASFTYPSIYEINSTIRYSPNGSIIEQVSTRSVDGLEGKISYWPNGVVSNYTVKSSDGSGEATLFDARGLKLSHTVSYSDGSGLDEVFNPDGTVSVLSTDERGGHVEYVISIDGRTVGPQVNSQGQVITIRANRDYTIQDGILNLELMGTTDISGVGNAWNNIITGNIGSNSLTGAGGNDTLYGLDGNDILKGGVGSDLLAGGMGNDTYIYDRGDGKDVIDNLDPDPNSVDIIRFGPGIHSTDITVGVSSQDLILNIGDGTDQITILDWQLDDTHKVDRIEFDDGTALITLDGQIPKGRNPFLMLGSSSDDYLMGTNLSDVIEGGKGNDRLEGNAGDDIYKFAVGDGHDVLGVSTYPNVGANIVRFGTDITSQTVTFNRDGEDLILGYGDQGDSIRVQGWGGSASKLISTIEFNDGEIWDSTILDIKLAGLYGTPIIGSDSGDVLYAWHGENAILEGRGGDDTIMGSSGSDTLNGGPGNDALIGNQGGDIYIFGVGDGQDTIIDDSEGGLSVNVLRFTLGVLPTDIVITRTSGDLIFTLSGETDRVTFSGWYKSGPSVQAVEFSNGDSWGIEFIKQLADSAPFVGTASDDFISGDNGANLMYGLEGNDILDGGAGDDQLTGGGGDDALYGGPGQDTYYFGLGDGNDVLIDTFSAKEGGGLGNSLRFGPGITPDKIIATNRDGDLTLSIIGHQDSVRLAGWVDAEDRIDTVIFADGTAWSSADLEAVMSANTAPILLAPLGSLNLVPSTTFLYQIPSNVFQDPNPGDSISYSVTLANGDPLPNWLAFDQKSRTISGTTGTQQGVFQLNVNAADQFGASVSDVLTLSIKNPNNAPSVGIPISDIGTSQGANFFYTLPTNTFVDSDAGDSLTLTAGLVGGDPLPHWLQFNSELGALSGNPGNSDVGNWNVTIAATDQAGAAVSTTFNISVANVNDAPFLNKTLSSQNGMEGEPVNFTIPTDSFLDIDAGDSLSYLATLGGGTALPNWLTFDPNSRTFSGTPGQEDIGTIQVAVHASDTSGAEATGTFQIDIAAHPGVSLVGTANSDILTGFSGADTLDGAGGADQLIGCGGDDTYIVDNTGDVVTENANEGNDLVLSSVTYTLGANVENLTLTGTATVNGTGNALGNVLTGNSAANTLDGGAGADSLIGGAGSDIYVVDSVGDVVAENLNEGTDLVQSSVSYTLTANVENLTLTSTAAINGTGNGLANTLTGNDASNILDGDAGADTMIGGAGNDTYVVDNVGDVVTEAASAGTDLVQSSISYTLGSNVENLTLTGTTAINGTGNTLTNVLTGNSAANILAGGTGDDSYYVSTGDTVTEAAGAGTDTVIADVSWTLGANLENLTLSGTAAINATGNALNNVLTGNSAANTLNGGTGNDTMVGGLGDDTYVVDSATDIVTEALNEGTDLVQSSVTYTLATNVENLTLTGTTAINGTGNALNNVLTGNSAINTLTGGAGNDTLDGGAGNDTMIGGLGDDTYIVDSASDVVTENASEGTDTVRSSVTLTLANNVENLVLTGTTAINATGNTLNNVLTGNSAANTLSGGTGADTMIGGAGDDTYVVDNTADAVTENANEGTDLIQSTVTYTLAANVENLTLTGTTAINGTGNTLDNVLTGNAAVNTLTGGAGNDTLNGGTGADTMVGGLGNDIYMVDNTADIVTEALNEGTDLVQSSVTYTLSANVDNLTLTGTTAINGTGNALNNILIGNSANNSLTGGDGNDTLDGGVGNDTMVGGLGDDVYVVNVSTDVVTEAASAGNDTIQSAVTLTLTTNIENLVLTGTTAINGTGNTLNNLVRGNTAVNTLSGGTGNDILEGGDGNDILTDTSGTALFNGGAGADTITGGAGAEIFLGGLGNDTYTTAGGNDIILFNKGDGQDTFATGGTGSDAISLGGGITYADLVFNKATNDLVLKIGATDQITFKNWYAATPSKPVTRLQVMAEAMADFVQGGSNLLMDQKVENFNFAGLAGAFDTARAANTSLTSWALTNALTSFQLAGSDTAALGGDLAYQYGKNGTLAGIGVTPALATLSDANLGTAAQTLTPLAGLQTGSVRLS